MTPDKIAAQVIPSVASLIAEAKYRGRATKNSADALVLVIQECCKEAFIEGFLRGAKGYRYPNVSNIDNAKKHWEIVSRGS